MLHFTYTLANYQPHEFLMLTKNTSRDYSERHCKLNINVFASLIFSFSHTKKNLLRFRGSMIYSRPSKNDFCLKLTHLQSAKFQNILNFLNKFHEARFAFQKKNKIQ